MSEDPAYGSKGWEFESLRARFQNLKIHGQFTEAAEVDRLTVAAFVCLFLCLLQSKASVDSVHWSRVCMTCGSRKLEKILPQEHRIGWVGLLGEERAAKAFSYPQYLPSAKATPTRIDRCQVEQLERACERVIAPIDSAGVTRSQCAFNLAADVGELFDE